MIAVNDSTTNDPTTNDQTTNDPTTNDQTTTSGDASPAACPSGPIAVTGATGFLGKRATESLLREGCRLRCLVRGASHIEPLVETAAELGVSDALEFVRLDLRDRPAVVEALQGCPTLVHLAAGLTGSTSTLFASGPIATRHLLHAAADAGVVRVVLISSLGVYEASSLKSGGLQDESCSVDRRAAQRDPYSYAKIVQERVAREVADERDLELVVLRPGVIFGEGRPAISSRAGLQLGGLLVQLGGRQRMPYTYVANCGDAVARAAIASEAAGQTLNILDDDLPTASQLIKTCRKLGRRVRRVWVPGPLVPGLCGLYHAYSRWTGGQLPPVLTRYRAKSMWRRVRYTNERVKTVLGWSPRVPMAEAIARTVAAEQAK